MIVGSVLIAVLLNLIGIPPMTFLFLAAVLNGLSAPALMIIVFVLARNKVLLGKFVSPRWSQWLLGVAILVMVALPVAWLFTS